MAVPAVVRRPAVAPVMELDLRGVLNKQDELKTELDNMGSIDPLHNELEKIDAMLATYKDAANKSRQYENIKDANNGLTGKVNDLWGQYDACMEKYNTEGARLKTIERQLQAITDALGTQKKTNNENNKKYLESIKPKPEPKKPRSWCSLTCVSIGIAVVSVVALTAIIYAVNDPYCVEHFTKNSKWSVTACIPKVGPTVHEAGINLADAVLNAPSWLYNQTTRAWPQMPPINQARV